MSRLEDKKRIETVNIATLKAQLAKYLRMVKAGEEIVVLEHKMPVAKIVRIEDEGPSLSTIKAQAKFSEVAKVEVPPLEKKPVWDSLELLKEERGSR